MGHEFCVLSSILEFWLMVYGFVFKELPLVGGARGVPRHIGAMDSPPPAPKKHSRNLFPEFLAASVGSWGRLEAPGIDSLLGNGFGYLKDCRSGH